MFDETRESAYNTYQGMPWEYFQDEEEIKVWFDNNVNLKCDSFSDLTSKAYELGFEIYHYSKSCSV